MIVLKKQLVFHRASNHTTRVLIAYIVITNKSSCYMTSVFLDPALKYCFLLGKIVLVDLPAKH